MQEILPLVTPEVQQLDGAAHLQRLEKRMEHLKRAIHHGSPHGNDKMAKPKSVMLSQMVSHTRFCIFPHNLAPDFLQYISGNSNQRTLKIMKV